MSMKLLALLTLALFALHQGLPGQQPNPGDAARYPLQPVEVTSPRATLRNFLDNLSRSHRLLMSARDENEQAGGLGTPDSVLKKAREAEDFLRQAVMCLNLSEVPEALKENVGYRQALKLKDILDRIELPPFDSVPDEKAIESQDDTGKVVKLRRWRVPHTEIDIARVEDGPRTGEYLFTPGTVRRLDEFHAKVGNVPYKKTVFSTPGFYEYFISTPGRLLSPKWAAWLPQWSMQFVFEQPLWKWLFLAVYAIISGAIVVTFFRRINPWGLSLSLIKTNLVRISYLLLFLSLMGGLYVLDREHIAMTGFAKIILTIPGVAIFWLLLGALLLVLFKLFAEAIIGSPKINPADIQASYIRAVFTVIGFVGAAVIFIYGLSRVGVSLTPLLAGVGIGGFAVALAARPTLENIIGSFMIFTDKPFKVGQRIKVMGYDGTVEEIGLRSTKIRLLDGNLTIIPNEKMVTLEIENIGRRPHIRRLFNLSLPYHTPPESILRAVRILGEILAVPGTTGGDAGQASSAGYGGRVEPGKPHPNEAINKPGYPPRVYFNQFNPDSLNIFVIYWYHPPEWWEYLEHAHWINLRIIERFNAEGIEFAFPTQTIHLAEEVNALADPGRTD